MVTDYLRNGGSRAETRSAVDKREPAKLLTECPICGEPIVYGKFAWSAADIWHCQDNSHYWIHRAEMHDGAARKFMTEPTTGILCIDEMSVQEYERYLDKLDSVRVVY